MQIYHSQNVKKRSQIYGLLTWFEWAALFESLSSTLMWNRLWKAAAKSLSGVDWAFLKMCVFCFKHYWDYIWDISTRINGTQIMSHCEKYLPQVAFGTYITRGLCGRLNIFWYNFVIFDSGGCSTRITFQFGQNNRASFCLAQTQEKRTELNVFFWKTNCKIEISVNW